MDKRKILTAMLDYINPPGVDHTDQKNAPRPSREEQFIQEMVRKNINTYQKTPPSEILHSIKLEINLREHENIFKKIQRLFFSPHFQPRTEFVFSAIMILILVTIYLNPWHHEKSKLDQMSVMATEYVTTQPGEVLQETGLRMSALNGGELAFEIKSHRQHIYLKKGDWHIETDYSSFDKEIWFHFPGGGVKPIAAYFSIDIGSAKSKVTLNKGKIQAYSIDNYGVVNKTTIENAPYAFDTKNNNLVSFYESDLLAERSNSMVVQKDDPAYHQEQVSVYRNFVGAYISVLLNDGSRLSGVLKNVWNEKLHIQTGTGMVEIHGRNMTLVGLNTMDY